MPLTGDAKRKYQAELMAKRRGETKSSKDVPASFPVSTVVDPPFRAPNGNLILQTARFEYSAVHVHNFRRKLGEETAQCATCAEIVKYEGKALNIYNDGLPDWPQLIRESTTAPEIQKKMPVTAKRT